MRALAVAVNLSAATVILGTVRRRVSSVMVPTTTMVFAFLVSEGPSVLDFVVGEAA